MADAAKMPVILPPPHPSDDEVIDRRTAIPTTVGGESPLVIMELLQRMKVRDVMRKEFVILSRRDTMSRAQELMRKNHISGSRKTDGSTESSRWTISSARLRAAG